jgi:serine/threonine protein kinase
VLDFGLATVGQTSTAADPANSPTLTISGVIMGTAGCMSPEQARGATVDKRADIWAFGVVLYEMMTGCEVFSGETVSDKLASVLKTDPDWSKLPGARDFDRDKQGVRSLSEIEGLVRNYEDEGAAQGE